MAVSKAPAKIRVVRIITRLNIGGPALHVILMSKEMRSHGYRTVLITGSTDKGEGDLSAWARSQGIRPILIPQLHRRVHLMDDLVAFFKLIALLRRIRPHIVCTHMAKAGTLGRLAAVWCGAKVRVHTFHGHIFHSYFPKWKTRIFLGIERLLARVTNGIFVISPSQEEELTRRFRIVSDGQVRMVRLGLDLQPFLHSDRFSGEFRKRLGVGEETRLVGIVGRLVPVKNHRMFLEAARLVLRRSRSDQDRLLFLSFGDGELRPFLTRLVRLWGMEGTFRFLGWQEHLERIYPDLDLVVLTSLNEGTPVALIESLAAGTPVIATDVGGVRDVVRDQENGLLVPSGDSSSLARAIEDLLSNRLRRQEMGQRGREWVRSQFTKERLLSEMDRHYRELLRFKMLSTAG